MRRIVHGHLSPLVDGLIASPDFTVYKLEEPVRRKVAAVGGSAADAEICHPSALALLAKRISGAGLIHIGECPVTYADLWLPDQDGWLEALRRCALPWQAVGNKSDRQVVHYGVRYYGHFEVHPWPPADHPVSRLRALLQAATGYLFEQAILNRYPTGGTDISLHSDAGDPTLIACASLGAARQMRFCRVDSTKVDLSLPLVTLAPGSLLIFDSVFNDRYKHTIVPDKSVTDERLSVTFRAFGE